MTRPCPDLDLDLYLDLEWDLEWDLELDNNASVTGSKQLAMHTGEIRRIFSTIAHA